MEWTCEANPSGDVYWFSSGMSWSNVAIRSLSLGVACCMKGRKEGNNITNHGEIDDTSLTLGSSKTHICSSDFRVMRTYERECVNARRGISSNKPWRDGLRYNCEIVLSGFLKYANRHYRIWAKSKRSTTIGNNLPHSGWLCFKMCMHFSLVDVLIIILFLSA